MFTWADLDEANKRDGHYNRKPGWLVRARNERDELYKREIEIIDAYEDGLIDWNEVKTIQRRVMQAERECARLYERWCNSEGIHKPTIAEKPAEVVNG